MIALYDYKAVYFPKRWLKRYSILQVGKHGLKHPKRVIRESAAVTAYNNRNNGTRF